MRILKSSKKGDGGLSSTLVIMTAAIISLLVLMLVTGAFGKMFNSIAGKQDCQIQFLVSSFTKTGGVQTVDPVCEPHLITIDQKYLDNNKARAIKTADKYMSDYDKYNNKIQSYTEYRNKFEKISIDSSLQNQWVIDEAFAKEMKYCWDITGRGKLDLFSNWEGMFQCGKCNSFAGNYIPFVDCELTDPHPCTTEDIINVYKDPWYSIPGAAAGIVSFAKMPGGIISKGGAGIVAGASTPLALKLALSSEMNVANLPPTFCVLCSRIKFSEVPSVKGNVGVWLANTPVLDTGIYSKVSYTQYLKNDNFDGVLAAPNSYAYSTDKTYAVVYARVNSYMYKTMIAKIGVSDSDKNKDIQMIKIVEYPKIKDECTLLVG